jgi:ABC-type transport system substrate-binding protein
MPVRAKAADCGTKTLNIRVKDKFRTFDPANAQGTDAIITRNIFAPLVRYKRRANANARWEFENELISGHSTGDKGLSHTFVLRDEVWASGQQIFGSDVKFSFDRVGGRTNPVIESNNRGLLDNIESVSVVDDRTIVLRLKKKDDNLLLNVLPQVAGCVVPKSFVEDQQDKTVPTPPSQLSGRYTITEFESDFYATLCANDTWKGTKPTVKSAKFHVIPDDQTAQDKFKSGEIQVYRPERDVLYNLPNSMAGVEANVFRASTSRVAMATINSSSRQLEDIELRQAVQQSIDISAARIAGYGTSDLPGQGGVIAPGWLGGDLDLRVDFDPEWASVLRDRLSDPLRILPSGDPVMRRIAEAIADQWREAGVQVELLDPSGRFIHDELLNGSIDIAVQRSTSAFFSTSGLRFDFAYAEQRNAELANAGQQLETMAEFDAGEEEIAKMRTEYGALLIQNAAVLPIAEDHEPYFIAPGISPAFSPDGTVGNLGDWEWPDT